jgi:hypothetical protein
MSAAQGRFTSVDPLLASGAPVNPKTWNRYAYTLNNPLRYVDPTGLYAVYMNNGAGPAGDRSLGAAVPVEAPPDGWNPVDGRALYDAYLGGQRGSLDETDAEEETILSDDGKASVSFTTVQVIDPPNLDSSPNAQTYEISGLGALNAVTLNLEKELGANGEKVDKFTIRINFILPRDYKEIKEKRVTDPNGRWNVLSEGKFVLTDGTRGYWELSFRQKDKEGKPNTAAILNISGTLRDGNAFGGSLRIKIITTSKDLPKNQRDKP